MSEDVKKLTTKVLRSSKGAKVSKGDNLLVNYAGTFLDGEQFDANYNFESFAPAIPATTYITADGEPILPPQSTPFDFIIGAGQVIEGWDKGLNGRRIGEVLELTIPADQAYGEEGSQGGIPPNSPLRFTVELLATIPEGNQTPVFPDLKDIGLNTKKLGLNEKTFEAIDQVKIGLKTSDRLDGDESADLLIGMAGNDQLMGQGGADVLIGGDGKDHFIYTDVEDSLAEDGGGDRILDFGKKDKIKLRAMADELQFIGADPFTGAAGDVRFKNNTLSVDIDGDQSADFAVELPGVKSLKGSNLIL